MPLEIREKKVDVNGIETHYYEGGTGEPLVLLHGGGPGIDAWLNWQFLMPKLVSAGYRVLAPDLVGFGKSEIPHPDNFDYDGTVFQDHVVGFVETLELSRPTLVGQSFGASVAIGTAIKRSDLIDKLVLFGPSARLISESDPIDQDWSALGRSNMEEIVGRMSVTDQFDLNEAIDRRIEMWNRENAPEAYAAIRRMLEGGGLVFADEDIANLPHQTIIFQGKDDDFLGPPVTHTWEYMELIDNASLYVIKGSGHWEMVDQVNEVESMLRRFL
ncbi:alpha/beta fold hydrolase [Haloarchaeobius salinus]|uniref:alpha/beta fold hydrolase n=1 Tax=Haloarchaeobius salinus TaxID=1198298 RepID=UPI002108B78A|nr:alpha/beta hydrolase [Haloarchaeobius salinus]